MPKKYQIEKILHELIRDLPDARKAANNYRRGLLTLDECLNAIAAVYRAERENRPD